MGYKCRYAWLSYFWNNSPAEKDGKDNIYFEGFAKFDFQEEKFVKKIKFGPSHSAGEVFYHPRDNAKSEDDGYMMSFVFDWKTKKTEFVMWDALTMNETPVLRVETKERVPHGFHTWFVQENEIEV